MAADRVAEGDRARCLEARDRARDELTQDDRIGRRTLAKLHHPDHLLAEALAGPSDHDRVDDVRVTPQHLLDLLDEDLLATAVHDHRVAPEEHDLPIGREPPTIARDGDTLDVDYMDGLLCTS